MTNGPMRVEEDIADAVTVRRPAIAYGSAAAAFDDGNYAYAARHAEEDQLLRGAALIMLGHEEGGWPYLEGLESPWAAYYRAIALWGQPGGEREALAELRRCLADANVDLRCRRRAGKLERLIAGGPLRVLVQGKHEKPPSSFSIVHAMKQTSADVISIGYQPGDDISMEPYESLEQIHARLPKGWAPSFYHCYQVESNLMPIGLEDAPYPLLGYASDYDTRVQTCYYRAQAFDAMAVTGEVDHHEIRRGFRLPCILFPKAIGVWAEAFERADPHHKTVDLFCSGSPMSFYQVDKGRLVYRLMQLSDRYRVRIHRGFLTPEQYVADTCGSKVVFSFVRRQPVWSSRATDALAGGAVVLYQEGGGLELFYSEMEGAVPYREDNLEAVIERVLGQWDETYAEAALRGRARVLREFDLKVCMERYLKRLAILGAEVNVAARGKGEGQRRERSLRYPPFPRGAIVVGEERRKAVWTVGFQETVRTLRDVPADARTANEFNILAFSHFLLGFRKWQAGAKAGVSLAAPEVADDLTEAWRCFATGVERFPDDLVLRFNWGRVACLIERHQEAYEIFGAILNRQTLHLDPLGDLFGDDFADRHLAFRAYIDGVVRYLLHKKPEDLKLLLRIVLASVWWYRGMLECEQGQWTRARRSVQECHRRFSAHAAYHDLQGETSPLQGGPAFQWTGELVDELALAWKLAPYSPGIMRRLTIGLDTLGRSQEAACARERYARISRSLEGLSIVPLPPAPAGAMEAATIDREVCEAGRG